MNYAEVDLEQLFEDLPGITQSLAGTCYEAIIICLEDQHHESGVTGALHNFNDQLSSLKLVWTRPITEKTRRSWGEARNAVEDAAVGIAYLLIPTFTEYTVIERANIGEGVDYYLGYKEDVDIFKFQRKARLEVSGSLAMDYPKSRVNEKIEQSKRSDSSGLPAYIVVTQFRQPVFYLVQR